MIRGFMAFAGFPGIPHQASLHGEHIHVPLCEEFFMITSLRISAFAGQYPRWTGKNWGQPCLLAFSSATAQAL